MGLRTLHFTPVTVETSGGSFAVRGLTPDMVIGLYDRHRGNLAELFDFVVAQSNGEAGDPMGIATALVAQSPAIMAELIALASGSDPAANFVNPDTAVNPRGLTDYEVDVEIARGLPLPVQLAALIKIADQTFSSEMPPGKFLAVVIKGAGVAAAVAKQSNG